ncbi:hypothetical protein GCU49_02170 [Modestobacter roseus]|nr:hypothetical protein [Modestobacter roseus]
MRHLPFARRPWCRQRRSLPSRHAQLPTDGRVRVPDRHVHRGLRRGRPGLRRGPGGGLPPPRAPVRGPSRLPGAPAGRRALAPAAGLGARLNKDPVLLTPRTLGASLGTGPNDGVLPQCPELPGLECHSLRGGAAAARRAAVAASSPAGLMSA